MDKLPVELAVKSLFDAIHRGDAEQIRELFSEDGKFYLPAGAELDPGRPGAARMFAARKHCALYVRHTQMITADAAYVVALRRCPEVASPQDSGIIDLTLRREPKGWRLMSWREGLLEGVTRLKANPDRAHEARLLSVEERSEGWRVLFDGSSFQGWLSPSGQAAPSSWRIVDGALATVPRGAGVPVTSIRTHEEFTNFDLRFEWLASKSANSGCIYRLFGVSDGMEYQISDDLGDPGARVDPRQRAGALYGVAPVAESVARAVGEWNEARIRVTAERIEHWLNGVKTVDYPVDVPLPSPIVLQYHFTEVKFRNLKIRPLQ